MRRTVGILLVMAMVAAACGGDDTTDTTATPATTTAPNGTTAAPPAPPEDVAGEWAPAIAGELVELEAANDGQWTIETGLDAVRILRPLFLEGIVAEAPIDVARLNGFLAANFDQVPQDEWDAILAVGPTPTARLVSYQTEEIRQVYQDFAEDLNGRFEALSGHTLNVPIYVALSDLEMPADMYAGTWTSDDEPNLLKYMFFDEARWQGVADAFNDLTRDGGTACVIVLGRALTGWSEDRQLSGILHEVVHCHQHNIHPGGQDGFWARPATWMDEGYAAWAGEAFFGGTQNSVNWWDAYLDGGVGSRPDGFNLFQGSYRSFGFYSMLASGGVDPYGEFIPWFRDLRANTVSDTARYNAMTSGVAPDVIAGWTASSARNDEYGAPWNSDNGPGIGNSSEEREPLNDRAGSEPRTFRAGPGEQRYWAVQFNTAIDEPSLITFSAAGLGTYRWDFGAWQEQYLVTDSLDMSWCIGEDCVCEDGTSPAPGALPAPIASGDRPVLHSALFGGDGQASLTASVQTLEDACEDPPPAPTGPLDACLFGTWNPDPDQFADLLLTFYRGLGATNLMIEGTIDLTFTDEGKFSFAYAGVKGSGSFGDDDFNAVVSGGSLGTWEAGGGSMILNFTGTDIAVTVNDLPGTAPTPPPSSVDATYTCGASTLTVDPPATPGGRWPLPADWTKAP